jgi:regulatory protein SWI5
METPHNRTVKHTQRQSRPNRFAEDYDESMEETLKPTRGHRSNNRNSGVFAELRRQAEAMEAAQNQNTMSMPYADAPLSTTEFLNLTNMEAAAFIKIEEDNFHGLPSGTLNISPDRSQGSSPMSMHPNLANFNMLNAFDTKHDFDSQDTLHNRTTSNHSSRYGSPNHHSHHRRTESLASVVSAASIASINIEETKTDTGVTMEEITLYIDGPDATNGKWTCTYESCGKQFGRKENIKSHVQTHLNDRQYRCPTCKKCFVRQHDLKRHAKIHTGIKPYPCECGNSFARHDALTRHRQRGMCIGAFDGIVRKVVKRGRPRKINRPDMEERLEKSERTRRKIKAENATPSSASSQSGYEDSSAGNSPENEFDGVLDDAPFNPSDMDMMDVASAGLEMDLPDLKPARMTSPSGISTATMPSYESQEPVTSVSPEQITANSPSSMSTYSYHALPTLKVTNAHSPAKSVTSNYTHQPGTPPELSASSSPPCEPSHTANDEPRYFDDFDPNESGLSDHSIGLGTTAAAHAAGLELVDVDDEGVWGINEDGLVQMMGAAGNAKYFDDAEDAVALFTNGDDVFFGSS